MDKRVAIIEKQGGDCESRGNLPCYIESCDRGVGSNRGGADVIAGKKAISTPSVRGARRSVRLQYQNQYCSKHPFDQLYDNIERKEDRLLFIRYVPIGASTANWALVQVDLDETDEKRARKNGEFHVRWLQVHPEDKRLRSPRISRFCPVVRYIDKNECFGRHVHVSMSNVIQLLENKLNLGWYQMVVNLGHDRLSEPFDFATLRSARSTHMDKYRVDNINWAEMIRNAAGCGIDTSDVDTVPRTQHGARKRSPR
uniref:Uncharacterized protein n=2 Tax=Ditylum brightwellii TaxID=49249 RepID=A0A7S4RXZ1_9STRA